MLTQQRGKKLSGVSMLVAMSIGCGAVLFNGVPAAKADMTSGFEGALIEAKVIVQPPGVTFGPWYSNVGGGMEFSLTAEQKYGFTLVPVDIDFSNKSISFDYAPVFSGNFISTAFNGYIFTDFLDNITDIIDVKLHPVENTLGIDQDRISFNKNQIFVNVASLFFDANCAFQLDVDFAPAPVPEPATMLLFGAGLAGLAVAGRRKNN